MQITISSQQSTIGLFGLFLFFTNSLHSTVFDFGDHKVTVPDGFVVELVTDPSLTQRPITTDFDEQGRLYVAESSGSNDDVETQLSERPHSILRLEDTDDDGVFDQRTVFADKMMFPEGTLWYDGSLYVTAPPEIWKLTDTDDDGVADQREVWYNPGTLTNCANDLHGPFLGLDGWIYWCKGAFAEQTHTLTSGQTFLSRASHIFRRHPDGGGVESVMTGGMDNPVELAFMPSGERIFTATFIQHPGGGKRDGVLHAIYGGTYGKIHGVIDEHPRTGEVLEPITHLGPAAACALMRYESGVFGKDYKNNLFSSSFNLSKVTRHQLFREGASYRSVDSDFMVSDSADFHPTHIDEDADGSLLVVDTGGWYKLCCPTSQLHKPDVLGGIYRIRKKDMPISQDPKGLDLDWETSSIQEWAKRLNDKRHWVRKRAMEKLSDAGESAIPALEEILFRTASKDARTASVWTLARIDSPTARDLIRRTLSDSDGVLRQAALHSVALWRDQEALETLESQVQGGDPHHRRISAEALGRIGQSTSVDTLLSAAGQYVDRELEHSLTYALIEINDPIAIRPSLSSRNPRTLRTALIALDQMEGADLKAKEAIAYLKHEHPLVRETAEWIVSRHSDWGGAMAEYVNARFMDSSLIERESQSISAHLARLLEDPVILDLIATHLDSQSPVVSTACLQAIQTATLKTLPSQWKAPLTKLLQNRMVDLRIPLNALRNIQLKLGVQDELRTTLNELSTDEALEEEVRLLALEALSGEGLQLSDKQLHFLGTCLSSSQTLTTRTSAATTLSRATLNEPQLIQLTSFLPTAGPMELPTLLETFQNRSTETLGLKLIQALLSAAAIDSLREESLQPILVSFPDSVKKEAEELLARLRKGRADQAAHIERVLASLPPGDVRRGQAVFNSPATACNVCHAIGYLGGEAGPDLTTIGTIRTKRDLLEAILYPSASFVRSYEPYQVTTQDGMTYTGILKEETSQEVELLMGFNVPLTLARESIKDLSIGTVSSMPSGLTASLSDQELADLLEFLKQTRWR